MVGDVAFDVAAIGTDVVVEPGHGKGGDGDRIGSVHPPFQEHIGLAVDLGEPHFGQVPLFMARPPDGFRVQR